MRYMITGLLSLIILTPARLAANTEQERLANSAEAMEEVLNIPDALPRELLNKAECVIVMPSDKKFAIGIGGGYWGGGPGFPARGHISRSPGAPPAYCPARG